MNSICNNVLREQYRGAGRDTSLDDDDDKKEELPATGVNALDALESKQTEQKVREILDRLSERDRRLLREVFLEERDKDQVCQSFGVDRGILTGVVAPRQASLQGALSKEHG